MPNRIFVPLDGTSFGEHALPVAVSVARRTGRELTLVHVHVPPFSSPRVRGVAVYDERDNVREREEMQAYIDEVAERVRTRGGVRVGTIVTEGAVVESLGSAFALADTHLVVMATHGQGSPHQTWLGSISERLMRETSVPLLLVRAGADDPDPGRGITFSHVLVPCDGSALAEQVLGPAGELAQAFGQVVTLLRVVEPAGGQDPGTPASGETADEARAYLEGLAAPIRARGRAVNVMVESSASPATAILEAARACGADLIAMSTHGRGGLGKLLLGSVAEAVLKGAEVAMLLFRPGDR